MGAQPPCTTEIYGFQVPTGDELPPLKISEYAPANIGIYKTAFLFMKPGFR